METPADDDSHEINHVPKEHNDDDQLLQENLNVEKHDQKKMCSIDIINYDNQGVDDHEVKDHHNKRDGEQQEGEDHCKVPLAFDTLLEDIDRFLSSSSPPQVEAGEGGGDHQQEQLQQLAKDHLEDDEGKEAKKQNNMEEVPNSMLEKFLNLFQQEVGKRESNQGKGKWGQCPKEDASFLQALYRVSKLVLAKDGLMIRSHHPTTSLCRSFINVQQRAMSYLEDEFRSLLEDTTLFSSGPPKKQDQDQDQGLFLGYREDTILNMSKIARAMVSGGYATECCQVYTVIRRQAFDASLVRTGFEKVSLDDIQKMEWEALERDIPSWNDAFRACATSFFSKEKKLADAVFGYDHPLISSSIFSNLVRGVLIQLLNFAEAVAMTKRSEDKLFKFLDMYETLRDSVQAMEGLFPEDCGGELQAETFSARCRIGEAAISLFGDLENSIKSDASKTPVPGGSVHPLTRYTMNYLRYACDGYKSTLEQVFKEHNKTTMSFTEQLNRVMDLLDSNLEGKSKLYKDVSLSCIFMMNNGRYMLQKIKDSTETRDAIGDDWCRKKSSQLRNYHNTYKRETWTKLLGCLSHEGILQAPHNKVVKPLLKERFKGFNAMFDEIHRTQSSWVIIDKQLQSEVRVSISAVVIPAYRSFLGRFSQYLTPRKEYEKYIKYQPEDIEDLINQLFDGNASFMPQRRP